MTDLHAKPELMTIPVRNPADGTVAAWRVAAGRLLVRMGDRVAGCADLARGEAKPVVKVLG